MQELGLVELFERGGVFMWPLLVCSVLALAAILDRAVFFARSRYRVSRTLAELEPLIRDGPGAAGARPAARARLRDPIRALGLLYRENRDAPVAHRRNVLERHARATLNAHERRIGLLSLLAGLSPLLGLLGTVWGMVQAFIVIETLGERVQPADFAGGIWTALLTTVFGLVVAIPSLAAARFFEARVECLARDMNDVVSHLDEWTGQSTT